MTKINTFVTYLIEQDLFEDKVEVILSKQGDKLFDAFKADRGAAKPKCKDAKDVIEKLAEISKEYLQWLVTRYCAGHFYLEDKGKLEFIVQNFKKLAKKLKFNDINKYKDVAELEAEMRQFSEDDMKSGKQKSQEEKDAIEEEFIKTKKAVVYYDEGPIKVIIPKSVEASQYFGKGTRWCTAAETNNAFKNYSKGKNLLYIIMLRGHPDKYQIHFKTQQFMDPKDARVSTALMCELCIKYPKLTEIFSAQAKEAGWPLLMMGDEMGKLANSHDTNDQIAVIKYKIDTNTVDDDFRDAVLKVCAITLFDIMLSNNMIGAKDYKKYFDTICNTDDRKYKSMVDAFCSGYNNRVDDFVIFAKTLDFTIDEKLLCNLIKHSEASAGNFSKYNSYRLNFMVEYLIDVMQWPETKSFTKELVDTIVKTCPDFISHDKYPVIIGCMFEHLTDAQKTETVVKFAKQIRGIPDSLISQKWKARSSWKPAIKI